jgi:hypothetical protein
MLHEDECRLVDAERQQIALVCSREERSALGDGELGGGGEVDAAA